jgi:hypothetical protein
VLATAGLAAVATAASAAEAGQATTSQAAATSVGLTARSASPPCDGLVAGPPPAYGWPVKPFHRQHAVRGYFGDPRIGGHPKGSVKAFHFGVDVSAPDGTPVYATTDGVARRDRTGVVSIRRADGAMFSYWHIAPAVQAGQHVEAYKTVVGHIIEGWGHVHFAEYRSGAYINPLRPGAMGPYEDRTCPAFGEVRFERNGGELEPESLSGSFDIIAGIYDMPAMSAPAPWFELPVTPALVQWRVVDANGRVASPWRAAYDVRRTLPGGSYHTVYTDDTEQNRPNRAGRYRFVLARDFDANALSPGEHTVQVVAVDTQGNRAKSSWPLVVAG